MCFSHIIGTKPMEHIETYLKAKYFDSLWFKDSFVLRTSHAELRLYPLHLEIMENE